MAAPPTSRGRAISAAATLTAILAFAPATAHAGLAAGAGPIFPGELKVGQTFTGSIELRNDNTGTQRPLSNGVCNLGDAFPCPAGDPG